MFFQVNTIAICYPTLVELSEFLAKKFELFHFGYYQVFERESSLNYTCPTMK